MASLAALLGAPPAIAAGADDLLAEGASARERVLAGATAIAAPGAALAANPALLRSAGGLLFAAHFLPLPEGGALDAVSVVWPYGPGVLGGSLTRLGVGGIATFDSDGIPTGNADFGDLEMAAGYAVAVPWEWGGHQASRAAGDSSGNGSGSGSFGRPRPMDVGAALRIRRQSFGDASATGLGIDVGVALHPRPSFALGLKARNLVAPALTLGEEADRLPRSLAVGGAWTRPVAGRPLLLVGEGEVGGDTPFACGVEIPVAGEVVARAGTNGSAFRIGAGFNVGFLAVDYGLESHPLAIVHGVSVSVRLGQGAEELKVKTAEAEAAERSAIAAAAVERVVVVTVDTLRVHARSDPDPESARVTWLALRAHRPGDAEARAALDSLNALRSQETVAWRDSLRTRERELERAMARLLAASDSLAVIRRDLRGRDAALAAQRADLQRLGMLSRAAEALAAGENVKAAAIADTLAAAYPHDPEVAALRGRLLPETPLNPAQREEARRLYIEGMRRFNAGDYQGAIRYWEELLALDPGNRAVRLNLDEARARQGSVQ